MNNHQALAATTGRRAPVHVVGVALATVLALLAAFAVPAAASAAPAGAAEADNGLRGDYFTITNTSTWALEDANLKLTVLDPDIDVDDMLPVYRSTLGQTNHVGVRWTGFVTAPTTGDYTFTAIGDNGFKLWVGGESSGDQLIDFYVDQWDVEQTATRPVHLEAGVPTQIRFDQFQNEGGANVHLRWESADAGVEKAAIPTSAFTPPAGFEVYDVSAAVASAGGSVVAHFPGDLAATSSVADHLDVFVDGEAYNVDNLSVSGADLTLGLESNVLEGAFVRLSYDGEGALTAGGAAVPEFNVLVDNGSEYQLSTPWAADVDPNNPLPEYPRPQLERKDWQSLNGQWDFAGLDAADSTLPTTWEEKVTVPFPIESALSGIQRHEDFMAYSRTFTVPSDWKVAVPCTEDSGHGHGNWPGFPFKFGFLLDLLAHLGIDFGHGHGNDDCKGSDKLPHRLMLNFDAVDHEATVYVNGTEVAHHEGGYDAFSADVTDALQSGTNTIVVRVNDETGLTAKGKQSQHPGGIFYTPASGIWQTVWMEPVAKAHVDDVVTTPTLSDSGDSLDVTVRSESAKKNAKVTVKVKDENGKTIASAKTKPNTKVTLDLGKTHRWTPDTPYLYDVEVKVKQQGRTDTVTSYAGIRSIAIEEIDGTNRIVLNGEQTFLLSTLDQGFWPDGVYTAPTDEALAWDIQETKDLGFNTIRKHIKVESPRWYYHADQIGMMVWQDMPSAFSFDDSDAPGGRPRAEDVDAVTAQWETELHAMIDQHRSVPSIIGWVPFNEGWGEWNLDATARVAGDIKADDPTRLVNTHSGVNCCLSLGDTGTGDIVDHHAYTGPAAPNPDGTRAAIDGEHGGFSLSVTGHVWPGGSVNPYGEVGSKEELTQAYVGNTTRLIGLAREKLSGSVYTQITDVEGEVNGFWTYDRRVLKMDKDAVRAINEKVIAAGSGDDTGGPGTGPQEPVGGWNLDTLNDGATAGIEGSPDANVTGGASLTTGVHDQGLALNGNDGQASAQVDALDTTGSYSVATWVRLEEAPSAYATAVAADGMDGRSAFFLQYKNTDDSGGHGWAMSFPDGPRALAQGDATVGQWYHLTGVRDAAAGTLSLYVDGELAATETSFETIPTTGLVSIGRGQWASNPVDFLNGAVDDVRVYQRVLSASEISDLATPPTTVPDPDTDTVGWDFESLDATVTPGIDGAPDATVSGGAALAASLDGHGQALVVDGQDGSASASVAGLNTTSSYTVSAWVRLDEAPGAYASVVAADGVNGRSAFFLQYKNVDADGGRGWAMSFPGGPRAVAVGEAVIGQWYHLTGVRDADAGTLAIYVDGELAASEETAAEIASTGTVSMGRGQWDGAAVDFLHGALDEVRVFDRALDASEVADLAVR